MLIVLHPNIAPEPDGSLSDAIFAIPNALERC